MGNLGLPRANVIKAKGIRSIKLFRFFQMAGWGSFLIFFPLYLVEQGISLAQIGLIMAVPVLVGVFSGAMWSSFSDAIGRSKPF
jgi:MFS family permease